MPALYHVLYIIIILQHKTPHSLGRKHFANGCTKYQSVYQTSVQNNTACSVSRVSCARDSYLHRSHFQATCLAPAWRAPGCPDSNLFLGEEASPHGAGCRDAGHPPHTRCDRGRPAKAMLGALALICSPFCDWYRIAFHMSAKLSQR